MLLYFTVKETKYGRKAVLIDEEFCLENLDEKLVKKHVETREHPTRSQATKPIVQNPK